MSINIELAPQELAALRRATKLDDDAEAVAWAAREFLRLGRLRELKSVSGKVDFDDSWLKSLEGSETEFPQ
jgi:hypothetical protein